MMALRAIVAAVLACQSRASLLYMATLTMAIYLPRQVSRRSTIVTIDTMAILLRPVRLLWLHHPACLSEQPYYSAQYGYYGYTTPLACPSTAYIVVDVLAAAHVLRYWTSSAFKRLGSKSSALGLTAKKSLPARKPP